MLDPDAIAGVPIGPASDVAGGEDAGRAGLEADVDRNAAIDRESGGLGQLDVRPHADPRHEQIRPQPLAVLEDHRSVRHRPGLLPEMEHHALFFVQQPDEVAQLRAHDPPQRAVTERHHVDVHLPSAQRCRHLQPDEAGAEDDRAVAFPRPSHDPAAVGERSQVMHRRRAPLELGCEVHRARSRGEEERAVRQLGSVVQSDLPTAGIDRRHPRPTAQLDAALRVELGRMQRDPLLGSAPREVILRQIRPVVRHVRVGIDDGDRPGVALSTEGLRGAVPRGTASHDDDALGRVRPPRGPAGGLTPGPDEHLAATPLHVPARQIVQRRRPQRLTCPEAEAPMMQRAAHRVAHHQPLGERAAVVGAGRADGEPLVAAVGKQHRLAVHVAGHHPAIRNVRGRNALSQVRAGRSILLGSHRCSLLSRPGDPRNSNPVAP